MLTPNEIERFSMMLDPQMKQLEERIMADIVRRIRINGEITRAADWQINRMQQLGVSMKTVQDEIQRALGLSDEDMEKLYSNIAERGYARDSKLYEATGKHRIPFEENAELQQLISSVANQTNETMRNITQSLGFAVRQPDGRVGWSPLAQYYQKTLDGAMLDIASGAFDYNTVLKRVVSEMTNSGLRTIDYATGYKNRVDVAARRALMTGMSQITAKVNADNMEALDTEYVEVSWHGGARPSHQEWQGKVYRWRRGGNTGAAVPTAPKPQVQKVQYLAPNGLTQGTESGIIESKETSSLMVIKPERRTPKTHSGSSMLDSRVKKELHEFEESVCDERIETALIIPRNGNPFKVSSGKSNKVNFTGEQMKSMEDGIMSHNHWNGTTFSASDIQMLVQTGLQEMRACNSEGSFVLRRSTKELPGFFFNKKELQGKLYERENIISIRERMALINGNMTLEEFDKFVQQLAVEEFAEEYGFDYFFESR